MKQLLFIVLGLLLGTSTNAATWYVDGSVSSSGSGTTWGGAFDNLDTALDSAISGDEIWVAEGTYIPNSNTGFAASTGGINIYGGFPSGGGAFSARNWNSNSTILSGDADQTGTWTNSDRDHVIRIVGGTSQASEIVLDGFTIEGGNANYLVLDGSGAGILIHQGRALIKNCLITRNQAQKRGAGIALEQGAHCVIINSAITNNKLRKQAQGWSSAGGSAVGMFKNGSGTSSSFKAYNVTIAGNSCVNWTQSYIKLFYTNYPTSTVEFYNCIVWGNTQVSSNSLPDNNGPIDHVENIVYDGSNLTTGSNGLNIITSSPNLNSTTYELGLNSSAIDEGDNSFASQSYDLNHDNRIYGSSVDCGAYEFGRPVIYVDESVTTSSSSQTGATWALAFDDMESALSALTSEGYDVYVAEGTYNPTTTIGFEPLFGDLNIYGGFEAGGSTFANRDWNAYPTIFSGDLDNSGSGTTGDAESVFNVMGTGPLAIRFDGLVIERGYAVNGANTGGGVNADASNLVFDNTIVRNNEAADLGAGIFARASYVTVMNSLIHGNTTSSTANATGGAGIFLELNTRIDVYHSTIADNTSNGDFGGAIHTDNAIGGTSTSKIYNSIIWGNTQNGSNSVQDNGTGNIFPYTRNVIYDGNNWFTTQMPHVQNIMNSNPTFVSGGYQLQSSSPALDQANVGVAGLSIYDLDHNGRYYGPMADLGPYEYDPNNRLAPPAIANQPADNSASTENAPSGTEEALEMELSLFPNPSNGMVFLETNQEVPFTVYNSFGQVVQSDVALEGQTPIDLSNLSSGIYILKTEVRDFKIVLQK